MFHVSQMNEKTYCLVFKLLFTLTAFSKFYGDFNSLFFFLIKSMYKRLKENRLLLGFTHFPHMIKQWKTFRKYVAESSKDML